jgi:hypothetical protein
MTISENAACDPDPDPDTDTDTDTNTNQQQDGNVYIFTSSTRSKASTAEDLEAKAKEILAGETEAEKAARKKRRETAQKSDVGCAQVAIYCADCCSNIDFICCTIM